MKPEQAEQAKSAAPHAQAPQEESAAKASPRDRVLAAAATLFYNEGIRATGVEAIAARAGTTKMALYRHFQSKDALIVTWLSQVTAQYWQTFDEIEARHPDDPRAQIMGWAEFVASEVATWSHRGCPFVNSIAELPDREHPARQLIEQHKARQAARLATLCKAAGLRDPEDTAGEILFLLEGAQVAAQNRAVPDIATRLPRIVAAVIERQSPPRRGAARKSA